MTEPGVDKAKRRRARRRLSDAMFQAAGMGAVLIALSAVLWLVGSLAVVGASAFTHHKIDLALYFDPDAITPSGALDERTLRGGDYRAVVKAALDEQVPGGQRQTLDQSHLVSASGAVDAVRRRVLANPSLIGRTISMSLPLSDEADQFLKGRVARDAPLSALRLSEAELRALDRMRAAGEVRRVFNTTLFFADDSRDPELAGLAGAVIGSALALLVALTLAFPVGVGAAIYLEDFAPKSALTRLVEVNINNLAAVPSIVFGLLGLAVFLNGFGLPRSSPLVGGLVLSLMVFPTVIIATRAALGAVPQSIIDAALGIGASHTQAVFHHKVPLAMPGILTGTIISLSRALGETAPLLMIGMVAFVTETPSDIEDPATALPVQIFLWSSNPDRAWEERTAAAIIVLLVFLLAVNALAIYLRSRFEQRR